jgi:outer membrane protein OmpA-like peptidoglycan-associated protein
MPPTSCAAHTADQHGGRHPHGSPLLLALALGLALGGCAAPALRPGQAAPGPSAPTATPPGATAPNARTAGAEALAIEQRWLQDWFRGTPVRINQRNDGTLTVEVPREFCFDAGRSEVKPALGAVLDKVAESLRRRPSARLALLSAPSDTGTAPATLALQRAAGVQRHLRDRGVSQARLGAQVADGSAAVQLRIATSVP